MLHEISELPGSFFFLGSVLEMKALTSTDRVMVLASFLGLHNDVFGLSLGMMAVGNGTGRSYLESRSLFEVSFYGDSSFSFIESSSSLKESSSNVIFCLPFSFSFCSLLSPLSSLFPNLGSTLLGWFNLEISLNSSI